MGSFHWDWKYLELNLLHRSHGRSEPEQLRGRHGGNKDGFTSLPGAEPRASYAGLFPAAVRQLSWEDCISPAEMQSLFHFMTNRAIAVESWRFHGQFCSFPFLDWRELSMLQSQRVGQIGYCMILLIWGTWDNSESASRMVVASEEGGIVECI